MEFIGNIQLWFTALLLTAPRIMVAFTIMPMFAQSIFPALIRNGIMVVMSFAILPLTYEQTLSMTITWTSLIFLIFKEGVIGLVLGYAMSIPFWAVRTAGFLMDLQRGAMSALFFSPALSGMVSPLGGLLGQLATVMLFVSGGFLMLLETIMLSYQVWPLHQFFPEFSVGSSTFFLRQLDLLMYTVLLIAGPFMGIMFLIDFGTGLVGRYLPQLNIFLVAMPIKSALVFFMLIFYVVIIGHYLRDTFLNFGSSLQILDGLIDGRKQ